MEKPVVFFDLFETLVRVDRGKLERYFDRETDRLGDNGTLRDAKSTIWRLVTQEPTLLQEGNVTELASYYEDKMKDSLMHPPAEVLNTLAALKLEGYQLCVISDAARVDIMHWHESPLAKYFDDAVFSCDVGIVKPDAELYRVAYEKMGRPSSMLYVGDGGHDELKGAHEFGMVTAKAGWLRNRREDSITQYANCMLANPHQVMDVLREMEQSRDASTQDIVHNNENVER